MHSDLKPANFLLVAGVLKLIDFGIAKAVGDVTSATRDQQIGTINYMSPEALQDTCDVTQPGTAGGQKPKYKVGVGACCRSLQLTTLQRCSVINAALRHRYVQVLG